MSDVPIPTDSGHPLGFPAVTAGSDTGTGSDTDADTDSNTGTDSGTDTDAGDARTNVTLEFYWRPGCMFCAMLRRAVERRNLPVEYHNIWEDDDAAEAVRAAAGGNETVPTVGIAGHMLVNPSIKVVEELLRKVNTGELAPTR
ncbi:MAG: glutaredoxin domain-containing protein [Microthrixaceae bacterium]